MTELNGPETAKENVKTIHNVSMTRARALRIFVAVIIALVLFILGIVIITIVSLRSPISHRLELISVGFFVIPLALYFVFRKSRIRGILLSSKAGPTTVRGIILQSPHLLIAIPGVFAAFVWVMLLILLFTKKGGDKRSWLKEHSAWVLLVAFVPQVVMSYVFVVWGSPWVGLYIAGCTAYLAISGTVGGIGVKNGVMGYFEAYKAQSSPIVTMNAALIVAACFGIIHYAVSSLLPNEYVNLHNFQDALYFSVVTMATVGYGDIYPAGHVARWICMAEIASGFLLLVVGVSTSMTLWIQNHQPAVVESKPQSKDGDQVG